MKGLQRNRQTDIGNTKEKVADARTVAEPASSTGRRRLQEIGCSERSRESHRKREFINEKAPKRRGLSSYNWTNIGMYVSLCVRLVERGRGCQNIAY